MYQLSDSDSKDSDEGIRFKTDSIRYKSDPKRRSRSRSKNRDSPPKKSKKHRRHSSSSSSDDSAKHRNRRRDKGKKTKATETIGPQLPPDLQPANVHETAPSSIGPQLPPHLQEKNDQDNSTIEASVSASFGPALPPHLQNQKRCIGPELPPHLRDQLTQHLDQDEEEIYGPLPVDSQLTTTAQIALEERALELKMNQLEPCDNPITTREEWMLELPDVKKAAHLGLGPRQFRQKQGPDFSDRSSWTDTPNKKTQPKSDANDIRKQAELMEIQRRDKEQEAMSKKHKKKDKQSLLEMHQNKLKKTKDESGSSQERRPFNRELDLQVNRFDEAQKKAVLKKAQLLDDRFARGQSKFL